MPKHMRQNRKRINPRYFLYESLDREDIIEDIREYSKAVAGSRDTYGDMSQLAPMNLEELKEYFNSITGEKAQVDPLPEQQSLNSPIISENLTIEETQILDDADLEVLRDLHRHITRVAGGGNRGSRFLEILDKLGVNLGQGASRRANQNQKIGDSVDIDADDMEDAMGRFQDKLR